MLSLGDSVSSDLSISLGSQIVRSAAVTATNVADVTPAFHLGRVGDGLYQTYHRFLNRLLAGLPSSVMKVVPPYLAIENIKVIVVATDFGGTHSDAGADHKQGLEQFFKMVKPNLQRLNSVVLTYVRQGNASRQADANKDRVTDQMNLVASVSSSIQVHTWKCLHASSVSKRFVIHH